MRAKTTNSALWLLLIALITLMAPAPARAQTSTGCSNPEVPCGFPIEGGREKYIRGEGSGYRNFHTGGGSNPIAGWDYWSPDKTGGWVVFATHSGVVTTGTDPIGNTYIRIDNALWQTGYMHLKTIWVQNGQSVSRGDKIGTVGNEGQSDWPHLHYWILDKGKGVNVVDHEPFFQDPMFSNQPFGLNKIPEWIWIAGLAIIAILLLAGILTLITNPSMAWKGANWGGKVVGRVTKKAAQAAGWVTRRVVFHLIWGVSHKTTGAWRVGFLLGLIPVVGWWIVVFVSLRAQIDFAIDNRQLGAAALFQVLKPGAVLAIDTPTEGETMQIKVSHYWPPLGGTNCVKYEDGKCVSDMASGLPWEDYVDRAIACPAELPFGTKVYAFGQEWVCLDRGGAIVSNLDGTVWIDLLTKEAPVPFGTIIDAVVVKEGETNK